MLAEELQSRTIIPFAGIYDVFSAGIAARHYDALFVSGFGFAASYYGLPDIGFGTWTDVTSFVQRLRHILPEHFLLVDIDDGFCDIEVAAHTVRVLETAGASAVVLEDQRRPRKCGHFDGKQILDLDDYLEKLDQVLAARRDLFVVARTDSSDRDDILRRVKAFSDAGADAVLVDGVKDLSLLNELSALVDVPLAFNQIAGGKSPAVTLTELADRGVSIAIYSTPALFAAQSAIEAAMVDLEAADGRLVQPIEGGIGVADCNTLLNENLERARLVRKPRDRRDSRMQTAI
ncbi:MAG: isocitrate lyase/PEP mutase family protein [Acidimicrobiia bacterium]